jgi:hypothetical protein
MRMQPGKGVPAITIQSVRVAVPIPSPIRLAPPAPNKGQMSNHPGAAMMLPALPVAREPLADRGYDRYTTSVFIALPSSPLRSIAAPFIRGGHDALTAIVRHRRKFSLQPPTASPG